MLSAECVRTFPPVTFPATLLLKRDETETNKLRGVQKKEVAIGNESRPSVIAAVHHGRGIPTECRKGHLSIFSTALAEKKTPRMSFPHTNCYCCIAFSGSCRPPAVARSPARPGHLQASNIGKNVAKRV